MTVEQFAADIRTAPVRGGNDVDLSGPLAQHLINLGYRKPADLSPGLYKNKLGVQVRVEALRLDRGIIGPIWDASVLDDVFGNRHVVVTPQGLEEAGYSRVEDQ
ncbi:hypothetical protein [Arthrobacter sp. SD76]|uniref:hypothetical protein n=1 Tax=Arthrobacter sp. SD76 TaxID=3415007 RepID=UPI003C717178